MSKKGYNILVVDDVPHLRDVLTFSFEEEGNHVFGAGSCQDAYAILDKNAIDLVITDLHMPEENGLNLLDRIGGTTQGGRPCVFVLTAFDDVPVEELLSKGAEMVFAKPFSPEHLIREARHALGERDIVAEVRSLLPMVKQSYRQLTTLNPGDVQDVVLGRGGLFLPMQNATRFKPGDRVEFSLSFSEDDLKNLVFTGQVEWVRKESRANLFAGIGVRFTRVDAKTQDKLHQKIQRTHVIAFIPLGDKAA